MKNTFFQKLKKNSYSIWCFCLIFLSIVKTEYLFLNNQILADLNSKMIRSVIYFLSIVLTINCIFIKRFLLNIHLS